MESVYLLLVRGRPPDARLWPLEPAHIIAKFMQACMELGMDSLSPTRYSLRHGGASEDLLNKTRSLPEIKKRGLWKSDASLRRYAKEGRLLTELRKVPKE
eukprot:1495612-Karenia_brevis.AAC.1